jgi:uncharacterized protein (TIGR03118 family)
MKRTLAALVGAIAAVASVPAVAGASTSATHGGARLAGHAPFSGAIVIDWNHELLSIVQTPGAQPATVHPTRSFAILHAAIYDAVVSITGGAPTYLFNVQAPKDARPDAAAAQAGHDTLAALYPAMKPALDQLLASNLATIPQSEGKTDGIRVGHEAAERMLMIRANDGSSATPPVFTPGNNPGDYQLTPPLFAQPVLTHWAKVTPFVLHTANQFRPAAPPSLTSAAYATALNEVKSLGQDVSTTRTPEQTVIAKFWAGPIWNTWNEIAENAALAHGTDLLRTARLFTDLNIAFADSAIAYYDAKYTYQLWRPITAIREANTTGNPLITADPTWNPLATTALDPSYPGAHSTISAAGALILSSFFGDKNKLAVTSDVLPGVVRTFDSYHGIAMEAGLSRIYAGQHTRIDHVAGVRLGRNVAGFTLDALGRPAPAGNTDRGYVQHNLVSDIPGLAPITDPHLVNPWGMSAGPTSPLWISDNGTGITTLYDGNGNPFPPSPSAPLVVTIAPPLLAASGAVSAPTGQAFNTFDNTSSDFVITKNGKSGPAFFLFATEDGTISGWNPNVDPTHSVIAVDRSNAVDTAGDVGAVYKSLTLVTTPAGKFLYASNFRFGTVEVFDTHFNLVDVLRDPGVSAGFAPFGVQNVAGTVFVTFAKQNAAKHDDLAGTGRGFVDTLAPGTNTLHRFVTRGALDSPWAVTLAPSHFGIFGGDILVGNFGDGHINVFDHSTGRFLGPLTRGDGDSIVIDGLWGLRFGNGAFGAGTNTLFFTAGTNNEADGLFGKIVPQL